MSLINKHVVFICGFHRRFAVMFRQIGRSGFNLSKDGLRNKNKQEICILRGRIIINYKHFILTDYGVSIISKNHGLIKYLAYFLKKKKSNMFSINSDIKSCFNFFLTACDWLQQSGQFRDFSTVIKYVPCDQITATNKTKCVKKKLY